jgi:hypothetical protein
VAQSGNGIDLSAIYQLLSKVAEKARAHDGEFVRLNGRMDSLQGSFIELSADVADLRAAVRDYHTTVMGHGILYGEIDNAFAGSNGTSNLSRRASSPYDSSPRSRRLVWPPRLTMT